MVRLNTATLDADLTSETSDVYPPASASVPWLRSTFRLSRWHEETASHTEDGLFRVSLDRYLRSRGMAQKGLRHALVSSIKQSLMQVSKLECVIDAIRKNPSQEAIAAAIDLLVETGRPVATLARDLAFRTGAFDDSAAFVIAFAAARIEPSAIRNVLMWSRHHGMREGALEATADLNPSEAKPLLRKMSQTDQSAYIRERASQLLADFA